ncbi:complex I subunit 1 family protein [Pseudonocardia alni]|jgi:NADH-quinone oxidoreductase subunit H|uniref:complex I subunit 1 family protein n=1 Tax=Pseudonocardia TaxID=1847 RepID=UPI0020982357|nr:MULTISPECIES: NADH-quinone oxidoreductase subunit H [Pseudonocardia]MCO7191632.1 NADH-quinone oxidoreductase subunit H [Pseudonocardia sp. McavD-2-B]WFG47109.1 NADH-quinone oxidoreductase subunit H [Pseudonocardia alni]
MSATTLLLPALMIAAVWFLAALDGALAGRAAGRPVGPAAAAVEPVRATVRLLVGQRRSTLAADGLLRWAGIVSLIVAAVLAAAVVPLGERPLVDLSVGVVWFNAMEVVAWAAVWLVGWGPNGALSLVGGYRFVAQGLSYELPHMFAIITAALAAGSLRITDIVDAQAGLWFVVLMPAAFVAYLLSAAAMAFWGPFDAPVARDTAGGAGSELAGVDRLLFAGGRRLLLVAAAAMAVPLFLGGGHGPWLPAWAWVLLKTAAVLVVLVWLRHRLPTIRMDRWAEISWIVLVPLTIVQALVVALVVLARGGM